VPLYEAAASVLTGAGGSPGDLCEDELFEVIERQAQQGVDFITIHCGLTERALKLLRLQDRCLGIVSRGGSFIAAWMLAHGRENPLYERYDELLDIARRYDVTLSLGDGLRPGCRRRSSRSCEVHLPDAVAALRKDGPYGARGPGREVGSLSADCRLHQQSRRFHDQNTS
jgi:phosphomethylpyrimidine synthase